MKSFCLHFMKDQGKSDKLHAKFMITVRVLEIVIMQVLKMIQKFVEFGMLTEDEINDFFEVLNEFARSKGGEGSKHIIV